MTTNANSRAEAGSPKGSSGTAAGYAAYYVESNSAWFVVFARNNREARREGVEEFGSRYVKGVRLATDDEITYYRNVRGQISGPAT